VKFVKIGDHRINLDLVSEVRELSSGHVRVFWNHAVMVDVDHSVTSYDDFKGDEAALLLAYVDDNMMAADTIKKRIAAKQEQKEPACHNEHGSLALGEECPHCGYIIGGMSTLCVECEQRPESEPGYIWQRTDTDPWEYTCPVDGSHWNKIPDIPF